MDADNTEIAVYVVDDTDKQNIIYQDICLVREGVKNDVECLVWGYKAGGTYTVKAASESEAQEKALTEICDKLYRALPELDIEVSVELYVL